MKSPRYSRLALLVFGSAATLAHAHPGHDGHELTWDFAHPIAHPASSAAGLFTGVAVAWIGWKLIHRLIAVRAQRTEGASSAKRLI
ncbi:MAG: hypothetical protein Q7S40_35040 [Opitutaceae bacterium]|nr:hypothetical protein [Opitutaceae bacterium]